MDELHLKHEALKNLLKELGQVAVAYSNGVDSTFLLKVAHDVLGRNAIAVTVASNAFPGAENKEASDFCAREKIEHVLISVDVTNTEAFKKNPPDRCYHCKKNIFTSIINAAKERGIDTIVDGSNKDDEGDYRPGIRALKELGIKSPLKAVGLTKNEIRSLSKELGLSTWSKPAYACLATRFPYGDAITKEKLGMVERAEAFLINKGFLQMRVRIHGMTARIEVLPEDFDKFLDDRFREEIYKAFKDIGFEYVSLDLKGYRMGSMNENVKKTGEKND
ncbi:MAG: ATP-dependent sacrificial sulfur transferase LarE [Lachnospiraceae bacterium]|nr:ATP-dependent sacrificial sulfur transferase LarE [Lachnospiraceae bacterium]